MRFEQLNLQDVGHGINLSGAVWGDGEKLFVTLLPWEDNAPIENVEMTAESWQALLKQADELFTEIIAEMPDGTLGKAILRKSTRQIDQRVSWRVYKRDGYKCRYCGADDVPLTVDHLVLWEHGGPSTEDNLLSACRQCNKTRGNTEYADWLQSKHYRRVSRNLAADVVLQNFALVETLGEIPRRIHKMSR